VSAPSSTIFGPAKGARIILIEDEPLIAENLRTDLVDAGFEVVGVASRIGEAMKLIEEIECDAAILDANLAGTSSAPAAAALAARNIPCIVLSGYARDQLSSAFSEAFYVQKPYRISQLAIELAALVGTGQ
jgi:DNA-binding response OmpR family regulator